MCWVAVARGWSEEHHAFVHSYDSDTLDASSLPQALTHLALISAAVNLNRALGGQQ